MLLVILVLVLCGYEKKNFSDNEDGSFIKFIYVVCYLLRVGKFYLLFSVVFVDSREGCGDFDEVLLFYDICFEVDGICWLYYIFFILKG